MESNKMLEVTERRGTDPPRGLLLPGVSRMCMHRANAASFLPAAPRARPVPRGRELKKGAGWDTWEPGRGADR